MAIKFLYIVFALVSFVNGAWMLLSSESWYTDLPAGVPDTGPYNGHFIRDLGIVFVLISAGFIWCTIHPNRCKPVLIVITIFFTGHAILHILDLLTNRLPHSHWRIDIPAVFLPALLLILFTATRSKKPK
jgi:hypothetical protein